MQDIPLTPSHPSYATLHEIEAELPKFAQTPMLLVWGERDWCFTPHFRGQPRNTFKLLFNALVGASTEGVAGGTGLGCR